MKARGPGQREEIRSRRAAAAALVVTAMLGLALGCGRRSGKPLPAVVRGKVVAVDGKPLAGAQIALASVAGAAPVARATAIGDGQFRLEAVPAGSYTVTGSYAGFASADVPIEVTPGEDLAVVVRLDRSVGLQGRVEDRAGRAVATALVLAWPLESDRAAAREATTDEQGQFRLDGLPRGAYTVLVEGPGFGALHLGRVELPGRPIVVRLDEEGRTVSGQVQRMGMPAPGATVVLGGPGLRTPRVVSADGRGEFQLAGLGPGRYTVRARSESYASAPQTIELEPGKPGVAGMKLALAPGGTVSGRVVDEGGHALVAATVDVQAVPGDDCPELGRTDVVGYFQLGPLAPGRVSVAARLPGYVLRGPVVTVVGTRDAVVEVHLDRAAALVGRVTDDAGRPLANAVVSVSAASLEPSSGGLPVLTSTLPLAAEAAKLPPAVVPAAGRTRSTTTDAEGRFALGDVAPGPSRVEVTHPDQLPTTFARVVLAPGQQKLLEPVRMQAGALVAGRVLDPDGHPIDGARVVARRGGEGARDEPVAITAVVDAEGRFALRLPAGRYALHAFAEARISQAIGAIDVTIGRATPPLEFRLRAGTVVVQGTVRDPRGHALAGATVTAREAAGDAELARAVTGTSGHFRLPGLPDKGVVLEVRHPEWPPLTLPARAGELVVELQPPGAVEGEIRERGNGRFVTGASVQAIGADGRAGGIVRMLGAGFQIGNLRPGPWKLRVSAAGYVATERPVDVPPAPSPKQPSLRDVVVELDRIATAASK
jgi:protocatechuate 3,4-dioxygenase beta subunit